MTYLFGADGRAALRRIVGPGTLLVFDYDGTLAPHVADPARAAVPRGIRRRLVALGRMNPRIAVLSGRALGDLLPRVRGIFLAAAVGNHGSEWKVGARAGRIERGLAALVRSRERIAALGTAFAGAIEDKDLSYVVDLARLSPSQRRAAFAELEAHRGVRSFGNATSINVLPSRAPNKGDALRWLEKGLRPSGVLFVGNDRTDEDAFAAKLDVPFLGIRVGWDRATAATAFLRSQAELNPLLDALVAHLVRPNSRGG
jgi:trehalose 6-phosphate phosphatase